MSRKPCVVSSAHFAPLRSRMVLIATVVPCRNIRAAENCEPALTTPLSMPVTSRCGVVSVLPSRSAPVFSSNAATSVKVPPTSADRRIAESRNGTFTKGNSLQRRIAVISRIHQGLRRQIGNEAMRRRVCDEERQPGVLRRALRGDAAGPEHRHDPVRRRRHRAAEQRLCRDRRRSRPDRRDESARRG